MSAIPQFTKFKKKKKPTQIACVQLKGLLTIINALQFYQTILRQWQVPKLCKSLFDWPKPEEINPSKILILIVLIAENLTSRVISERRSHTSFNLTMYGCLTIFMIEISLLICNRLIVSRKLGRQMGRTGMQSPVRKNTVRGQCIPLGNGVIERHRLHFLRRHIYSEV